jgi:hypothetical protein
VLFGLSVYLSPLFIAGDFTNPQALVGTAFRWSPAILGSYGIVPLPRVVRVPDRVLH